MSESWKKLWGKFGRISCVGMYRYVESIPLNYEKSKNGVKFSWGELFVPLHYVKNSLKFGRFRDAQLT